MRHLLPFKRGNAALGQCRWDDFNDTDKNWGWLVGFVCIELMDDSAHHASENLVNILIFTVK